MIWEQVHEKKIMDSTEEESESCIIGDFKCKNIPQNFSNSDKKDMTIETAPLHEYKSFNHSVQECLTNLSISDHSNSNMNKLDGKMIEFYESQSSFLDFKDKYVFKDNLSSASSLQKIQKQTEGTGHLQNLSHEQRERLYHLWSLLLDRVISPEYEQNSLESNVPSPDIIQSRLDKVIKLTIDRTKFDLSSEEINILEKSIIWKEFAVQCCTDDPDKTLLRFLRARKWSVPEAFIMIIESLKWRHHFGVQNLLEQGEKRVQIAALEAGKNFFWKNDLAGNLVCYIRSRFHERSKQTTQQASDHTVYSMEVGRRLRSHDDQLVTVIFDMSNAGIASMDIGAIRFMVSCLQSYYPEILAMCLIKDAPWIFWSFWNIVKPFIDPDVVAKIFFVSIKDIPNYIDCNNLPIAYGGADPFQYHYIYPPYSIIAKIELPVIESKTLMNGSKSKITQESQYDLRKNNLEFGILKTDLKHAINMTSSCEALDNRSKSTICTSKYENSYLEIGRTDVSNSSDVTLKIRKGWFNTAVDRNMKCSDQNSLKNNLSDSDSSQKIEHIKDVKNSEDTSYSSQNSCLDQISRLIRPLEIKLAGLTREMHTIITCLEAGELSTEQEIEKISVIRDDVKRKLCDLYGRRDCLVFGETYYDRLGIIDRGGSRIRVDWDQYAQPGSPPSKVQSEVLCTLQTIDDSEMCAVPLSPVSNVHTVA